MGAISQTTFPNQLPVVVATIHYSHVEYIISRYTLLFFLGLQQVSIRMVAADRYS